MRTILSITLSMVVCLVCVVGGSAKPPPATVRKAHADRNKDGLVDRKELQVEKKWEHRHKSKVNTKWEAKNRCKRLLIDFVYPVC